MRPSFALALASLLPLAAACGVAPDSDDDEPADCGFVDAPFDPFGEVLQGASADGTACARLERFAEGEVRRDTEWQAERLVAVKDGLAFDFQNQAVTYVNTHHNCLDVARASFDGTEVSLTIDGVNGGDESACFDPASDAWVLVLDVDGETIELAPVGDVI